MMWNLSCLHRSSKKLIVSEIFFFKTSVLAYESVLRYYLYVRGDFHPINYISLKRRRYE
jgi:hypothetical protein